MKSLICLALLSVSSFSVLAQAPEDDGGPGGPPRWALGMAGLFKDSPYAGEGTGAQPIPLLTYNGERFYFRGITAGWNLFSNESFEVSAIAKFRFDGFDVKDLGQAELARNGIDYQLLEDRDFGLDAGIGMTWRGAVGEIELELLSDVTDASGGQEINLQYGYPLSWGKNMITPTIGATWLSKDMANYYYGTLDTEVARGVVNYKPGATSIIHIGVNYFRPLGDKWSVMAMFKYSILPDKISDSPLIEADTDSSMSVLIGVSRSF